MWNCDNLNAIINCFEEDRCHSVRTVLEYRRRLGECLCVCGEVQRACREEILYFLDREGNNIEIK